MVVVRIYVKVGKRNAICRLAHSVVYLICNCSGYFC